ncbi:MAG TPA: tetratricopeptide repeat protein [Steroidobacteraceae bacterium]|jgi:TPR repeat protein|nr:tetratricopeptide repeat protein [Steroidobacteraceae bacterium]
MLTEPEIHRGLVAIQDRDYRFVLSYCRSKGFDMPLQGPIACRCLEEEAREGNPESQFALAKLLSAGLFVKRDWAMALDWLRNSANTGFAPALSLLGSFYESGWAGLSADNRTAVDYWSKAAALGDPGAKFALAEFKLRGASLANRDEAIALLKSAASSGDGLAQFRLAMLLLDRREKPESESEAIAWLRMAADNGVSTAHRKLANFLSAGFHGLQIDEVAAREHMKSAARLDEQFE